MLNECLRRRNVGNMPKLQFRLRLLLLFPVCIAAFFGGWGAHESRTRVLQERNASASLARRTVMEREILLQRQIRAANLPGFIDRIEYQQRMKAFERLMQAPNNFRKFPNGEF